MLQLKMNLTNGTETPKTAMLAPIKFGKQLEIKMSWSKRFIINLKALYKLGKMTKRTDKNEKANPFKYGWNIVNSVLAAIDNAEGNYKKAANSLELARLAFFNDLLLESI